MSILIFYYCMRKKEADFIKQYSYLRQILKLSTEELKKSNWDYNISLRDAKRSGAVISLAESTCIRMIEQIAGIDLHKNLGKFEKIRTELRELRKEKRSKEVENRIKLLYSALNEIQFVPEYICLVCNSNKDFLRACKGFKVNGMTYQRFVGTTGGVKNSTVVFVAEYTRNGAELLEELRRRADNGRRMDKEFVPAKLEAYRALICSASTPLSMPKGVLVVDDCVVHFNSDYILLKDSPTGEPSMEVIKNGDVELIDSDGYGLMSPALAMRWQEELQLDYLPSGLCLRNSFCKGMAFTFDFHEFASSIPQKDTAVDIWGNKHEINEIELILTASMLKLWDSYANIDDYLQNCAANGYTFSATKVTPKELDKERRLNYQFIQSYDLSDDEINELVSPTLHELSDAMGDDYYRTLLFLRGTGITEKNAFSGDFDWVTALQADRRMLGDPFVRNQIKTLIKKKVNESKFGKVKVEGNFSVICGDPIALCQSIWGLPVTGLLKAGELYNRYWHDKGADDVVCFRAPMSNHNNIRKMKIHRSDEANYWYRYMNTVTLLNCHDMTCHALNGAD